MAIPSLFIISFTLQEAREFSRHWMGAPRRTRRRTTHLMAWIKHPNRNDYAVALPEPVRIGRDCDPADPLTAYASYATALEVDAMRDLIIEAREARQPLIIDARFIPAALATRKRTFAQMRAQGWFSRPSL